MDFYYDIDSPEPITAEDLPLIEKEMKKIINENIEIIRHDVSREEALKNVLKKLMMNIN